jgi:hypothetical protein
MSAVSFMLLGAFFIALLAVALDFLLPSRDDLSDAFDYTQRQSDLGNIIKGNGKK